MFKANQSSFHHCEFGSFEISVEKFWLTARLLLQMLPKLWSSDRCYCCQVLTLVVLGGSESRTVRLAKQPDLTILEQPANESSLSPSHNPGETQTRSVRTARVADAETGKSATESSGRQVVKLAARTVRYFCIDFCRWDIYLIVRSKIKLCNVLLFTVLELHLTCCTLYILHYTVLLSDIHAFWHNRTRIILCWVK